jgi:hypothetical protein
MHDFQPGGVEARTRQAAGGSDPRDPDSRALTVFRIAILVEGKRTCAQDTQPAGSMES